MPLISLLLISIAAQTAPVSAGDGELVFTVEDVVVQEQVSGLHKVTVPGFPSSDGNGSLLPGRTVMIPVPPSASVSVQVVPFGVHSLGAAPPIARSSFVDGCEVFVESPGSELQDSWGGLLERGTFRRAGYVSVRLNPVIVSDGELLAAGELRIVLEHDGGSAPETVRGHEGHIMEAVFGTASVWREPAGRTDSSPFWGKPWARIEVDTAGVYQVTGEMVPEAVGMPSGSLSLITGRGRMMSTTDPESDSFQPRSVPILVEDGGDGTFDASDRIVFYGRGLSWWGEFMGDHFNSMYDSLNTYWLTWGGEGGPFMEVLDGSLTGAQSAGASYVNRLHFEENLVLAPELAAFEDMYGWHRISSSSTANYPFSTPAATGNGTVVMRMYAGRTSAGSYLVDLTMKVNGTRMADTTITSIGSVVWEVPVTGLKTSGNQLSVEVDFSTSSSYIYTDWFQVFPETGYRSWSSQCQVPLDRFFQPGERRGVSWAQVLSDESFVCMALSDTAVKVIEVPGGRDFEIPMPGDWYEPVMWVLPGGDFHDPVSVSSASPGRILGTITEGSTAYVYPEVFEPDMPLFLRGRSDALLIPAQEIYDEFNGGVRDPSAVRAFFGHTVRNWQEPLDQIVLAGDGHWDPRNFISDPICFMDIIVSGYHSNHPICSDLHYSMLASSTYPQCAVSRIPANSRSELQLVAERSADYDDISEESGVWQSLVLGAADDERSPKTGADETYHTLDVEDVLTSLPSQLIPVKAYLIFFDWNSYWKKPEAREDYMEKWSQGALITFFLGHGGFDQIADEGLLFVEDVNSLACGDRMPWAFFGSCEVGLFQNPYSTCIAEDVTTAPEGGAIVASGCSDVSNGPSNKDFLEFILPYLLENDRFTMGESQWLGLLDHAYLFNDEDYIIFGDGSLRLALPDEGFTVEDPELYTSQLTEIIGEADQSGLVMVTAWESARPDSYYTFRAASLIEFQSVPGIFYRGLAQAEPDFSLEMFVPEVALTGDMARIRYFNPEAEDGLLHCSYPLTLDYGQGSPDDTTGPDMEMWIQGFRGVDNPSVSGEVIFQAQLFDQSGINLLPYPGNQLALYINDNPVDVSDYFTYEPGSATTGQLIFTLPELSPGDQHLRLRAADNLSNISWDEMTFVLLDSDDPEITDFFVYPTPATDVMSFNWVQSAPALVDISIYTVTGRKIAHLGNLSCSSGYNQHVWDLKDADGDMVASGSYIYVVSAGETELSGVAAVARQ